MYRLENKNLWAESVRINGVKKTFYGKTKAEISRKMVAYREQSGDRFDAVAKRWWDVHSAKLSVTTLRSYERPLDRAISHFGNRRIAEIKPCDVAAWITAEIAEHDMAKNTASNAMTVLRSIFSYAVEKGIIDTNPAREYKLPRNLKKTRRALPSDTDIEKIEQHPDGFGLFYLIAAYTGLRKGEILALQWRDVRGGIIRVTKSLANDGNHPQIKPPKTETGIRDVPIPAALAPYLSGGGQGFIFGGDAPLTKRQVQNRENAYRKRTGITCTVHQLRHAYASLLDEKGITVKEAQSLLGHAQASTTTNTYQHIRDARRPKIAEKVVDLTY